MIGKYKSRKTKKRATVSRQYGGEGVTYRMPVITDTNGRRFIQSTLGRRKMVSDRP